MHRIKQKNPFAKNSFLVVELHVVTSNHRRDNARQCPLLNIIFEITLELGLIDENLNSHRYMYAMSVVGYLYVRYSQMTNN